MAYFRQTSDIRKLRQASLKRGLNMLPSEARSLLKDSARFETASASAKRKKKKQVEADQAATEFQENVLQFEPLLPPVPGAAMAPLPPAPDSLITLDESLIMKIGAYWRAPSLRLLIDGQRLRGLIRHIGKSELTAIRQFNGPREEVSAASLEKLEPEALLEEGRICQNIYSTGLTRNLHLAEARRRAALVEYLLASEASQ